MNSYPSELLMQLLPVMFVAGLNSQDDAKASLLGNSEGPVSPVAKRADPFVSLAHRLHDVLMSQRRISIWQPGAGQPAGNVKIFQPVFVDKDVQFPPRKMTPPTNPQATPHSPLSPLMPTSPLHPDGLIAPIWIRKHTALVPSVFVLFVRMWEWEDSTSLSAETPRSPLETPIYREEKEVREAKEVRQAAERQHDTELSKEIAERKKITSERGIKLTVVLMASRAMLDDPTLDTRLTYIRRTSGLDARAALFVLSPVTQSELVEFIKSLQQALYEPAIEYYAAHSKRVRRKRNRHANATYTSHPAYQQPLIATGPPPLAPPQPLRPEGWTVRYEYKMACFAEFRGEEEVALKHYQDAYSTLLSMFGSNTTGAPSPGGILLIPRTKRWAEAKVLADCINVKIMKLFLCNAEHALALSQFRTHLSKFIELSERSWGIGRDTFEFWGWAARQYRVFAELLELGTQRGMVIPPHLPSPPLVANTSTQVQPPSQNVAQVAQADVLGTLSGLGFGVNPSTTLHHPGFYYLVAAECTERRRERFLSAASEEETTGVANQSPGFANEKKVDHLASILELYTKAYEVFKRYSAVPPISPAVSMQGLLKSQALPAQSGAGRFTILIAYRIAQTYFEAGKYDMAIRFFERIARTYRIEHFDSLLRPLLTTWCACARKLGDVEMGVRVLVEGVVCGSSGNSGPNEEEDLVEDLKAAFMSTVPSSSEPLNVEIPSHLPILNSAVTFWSSTVYVNEPSAFQIHLSAPKGIAERIAKLPVKQVELVFGDEELGGVVTIKRRGDEGETKMTDIELVNVGELSYAITKTDNGNIKTVEADLAFVPGGTIVLSGSLRRDSPGEIKFSNAMVTLVSGRWTIGIPFGLNLARGREPLIHEWYISGSVDRSEDEGKFTPVRRGDASSVTVHHRPHQLRITFSQESPAYLDELYPITLTVTNLDERELDIVVDVLLQPGEDDSVNTIELASQNSTGLIKGVSFGALRPGASVEKALSLHSTGLPGKRLIDFSIQSRLLSHASQDSTPSTSKSPQSPSRDEDETAELESAHIPLSTLETLQTLSVDVSAPFRISHDVLYRHKRVERACDGDGDHINMSSLQTFEHDWWDDRVGGEATVLTEVECAAVATVASTSEGGEKNGAGLVVEGIKVRRRDGEHCRIVSCSVEDDEFPIEFWPRDRYAATCEMSLAPPEDFFADGEEDIPSPGWYEITWRRMSSSTTTTTMLPLPSLRPPSSNLSLSALLDTPSVTTLHNPLIMTLVMRNNHPTRTACPYIVVEPHGHMHAQHNPTQSAAHTERPSTPTPANIASTSSITNTSSIPDPFVISGIRNGRAPILVPGAEVRVSWTLYPMKCGPSIPLPRVRVFDRREGEVRGAGGSMDGSIMSPGPGTGLGGVPGVSGPEEKGEVEVRVIDARWDRLKDDGTEVREGSGSFTVVVLPA